MPTLPASRWKRGEYGSGAATVSEHVPQANFYTWGIGLTIIDEDL